MALDPSTICVIANPKSGRNSHDAQAIDTAMAVFGSATLRRWKEGEDLKDAVRKAVEDGFTTIVAAGGDGTVMGVANALVNTDVNLAVLPLGTFNYFARGLELSQEPDEAARAILNGRPHRISVGAVNGVVFLNNASLGIYPAILKQRESVYERFGRRRVAAHWSVLKTFLRYRRPWRVTLEVDGERRQVSTPLIFVARSAYQLERFGLPGSAEISDDDLVAFIAKGEGRTSLLKTTLHLCRGKVQLGRDVDLLHVNEFTVETKKSSLLVAYDGEKARMDTPLKFEILRDALSIILPDEADRVKTP
ncbi:diacylglycerol/lipid kinase family protein [Falsirhodobacter sp. 20TX0035]|uniref:diacylglycerol/lipid kinase family protein n=1 Tax=Falsirhodobacter sp. 20TX0035 TaxID=3022019 RepID=UPI00232F0AE2|nr:diacylglycerol kinase family protein [Falsirhodobacter sp. 20TX0035]MDB6453846.1 diacylglycerol kinase family protein [Falsirhodobacter sp. 20TX0035]